MNGLYAGATFQNSPDPSALPMPMFFGGNASGGSPLRPQQQHQQQRAGSLGNQQQQQHLSQSLDGSSNGSGAICLSQSRLTMHPSGSHHPLHHQVLPVGANGLPHHHHHPYDNTAPFFPMDLSFPNTDGGSGGIHTGYAIPLQPQYQHFMQQQHQQPLHQQHPFHQHQHEQPRLSSSLPHSQPGIMMMMGAHAQQAQVAGMGMGYPSQFPPSGTLPPGAQMHPPTPLSFVQNGGDPLRVHHGFSSSQPSLTMSPQQMPPTSSALDRERMGADLKSLLKINSRPESASSSMGQRGE